MKRRRTGENMNIAVTYTDDPNVKQINDFIVELIEECDVDRLAITTPALLKLIGKFQDLHQLHIAAGDDIKITEIEMRGRVVDAILRLNSFLFSIESRAGERRGSLTIVPDDDDEPLLN